MAEEEAEEQPQHDNHMYGAHEEHVYGAHHPHPPGSREGSASLSDDEISGFQ